MTHRALIGLIASFVVLGSAVVAPAQVAAPAPSAPSPRVKMSLNDAWRFLPEDRFEAENRNHDDAKWDLVDVPHTWNVRDPFDDAPGYRRGPAWYRKRLTLDPQLAGKRLFLYFEGVHQRADVYVNDRLAGRHKGGYSAFCLDVTKLMRFPQAAASATTGQSREADLAGQAAAAQAASNVIAVRADSGHQDDIPPLSIGFGHYGGIYRDVWLIATDPVHFDLTNHASPGVFVDTPEVSEQTGLLRVRGTIVNDSAQERRLAVRVALRDPAGNPVGDDRPIDFTIAPSRKAEFDQQISIDKPALWSPDAPNLYDLRVTIKDAGRPLDEYATHVGFRWFKFDANEGFTLNGKRMQLRGASRHQDYAGLGSALPNEIHRRDLQWLKDMGANFIRVAHYPQDPEVLETADRLGLVAWEEIPVVSIISEAPEFTDTCKQMIREMIRQHYNHPSVVMWGTMNETLLDWGRQPNRDPEFPNHVKKLADELDALVRTEDPTRATALAMNQGASYDNAGIGSVPVVAGWNLYSGWYGGAFEHFGQYLDKQRQAFPNRVLFVSEYGAGDDGRLHALKPQRFDHSVEWMLMYHESHIRQVNARPWLAGVAIWNQFDFSQPNVGDSIPHMNQKGMMSFDRKPKGVYYLYQANWSSKPMLQIATRQWLRRSGLAGSEQPVKVYSNAAGEVELLLNGKSLGAKKPDDVKSATWSVAFPPGDNWLEARAGDLRDAASVNFKAYPAKLADPAMPFEEIAVNCGGNVSYADPHSNTIWEADQPYTPGSWGYVDGAQKSEDHWQAVRGVLRSGIAGTDADPLYQAFRRGMDAYRFDVPDGEYELELLFTEYFPNSTNARVMRITCNGQPLIDRLDLIEAAGLRRAVSRTFSGLRAAGGKGIEVKFESIVARPVISGIRVRRMR